LSDVEGNHNQPWLQRVPPRVAALAGGALAVLVAVVTLFHHRPKPAVTEIIPQTPATLGYATEVPAKTLVHPPSKLSVTTESTPVPAVVANGDSATVQLTTTPPGASFTVYPDVIAGKTAPNTAPLHSGTAPANIGDLPPGRYTLFFHMEGWPDDRAEISVQSGETLPVDYTFPHGSATITSNPDGVEILLGERSLGHTPLTVDLPLGTHQLTSRHPDLPKRTRTVSIDSVTPATAAFNLRSTGRSRARPTPTPSGLDKLGNSLKKIFSSRASPTPQKKR
jgi:hypothetical protein